MHQVDNYRLIAVVDTQKAFSKQDCVFVNKNRASITHLSVSSKTAF